MGKISDLAYNIGTSLNKEDINSHRQGIVPTAQTLQNLSTDEQLAHHTNNQALLDENKEQLEGEMESGDEFENKSLAGQITQNKYNSCAKQGVSREDCHSYIRQQNLDNLGTAAEDVIVLASVYRGGVGRASPRPNNRRATRVGNEPDNNLFSQEMVRLQSQIDKTVAQSQRKHILNDSQHVHGSYFYNQQHAQEVLSAFHNGSARIVGFNSQKQPIVFYQQGKGIYSTGNGNSKFQSPTTYYLIKGTKKVSIVPYSPQGPR